MSEAQSFHLSCYSGGETCVHVCFTYRGTRGNTCAIFDFQFLHLNVRNIKCFPSFPVQDILYKQTSREK